MTGNEKTMPVYIRVGDGDEYEVGTITATSGEAAAVNLASLLREVAGLTGTPK